MDRGRADKGIPQRSAMARYGCGETRLDGGFSRFEGWILCLVTLLNGVVRLERTA